MMHDDEKTPGVVVIGGSGKVGRGVRAVGGWPDARWLARTPAEGCQTVPMTRAGLAPHLAGCQTLVILAALTRHRDPRLLREANVELPLQLATWLMEFTPDARLIFLSSDLAAEPTSPYGRSKLDAEEALQQSHPDTVILRPAMVATPPVGGIPAGVAAMAAMAGKAWIPLIGDGRFPIRPLWVGDLARVVAHLAQRRGEVSDRGVWSLHGESIPYRALLELLAQRRGNQPRFLPIPRPLLRWGGELLVRLQPASGFPLDFLRLLERQPPQPPEVQHHLGLVPTPVATWLERVGEGGA